MSDTGGTHSQGRLGMDAVMIIHAALGEHAGTSRLKQAEAESKRTYEERLGQLTVDPGASVSLDTKIAIKSSCLKDVFVDKIWPVIRGLYVELGCDELAENERRFKARGLNCKVYWRIKTGDSIRETLDKRDDPQNRFRSFDEILFSMHDLLAFRFVAPNQDELELINQLVAEEYQQVKPPNDLDPQREVYPGGRRATMGAYQARNHRLQTLTGSTINRSLMFEIQTTTQCEENNNDTIWHAMHKGELGPLTDSDVVVIDNTNSLSKIVDGNLKHITKIRQRNMSTIPNVHEFYITFTRALLADFPDLQPAIFGPDTPPASWLIETLFLVFRRAQIISPLRVESYISDLKSCGVKFSTCESSEDVVRMITINVVDLLQVRESWDNWCRVEGSLAKGRYSTWLVASSFNHLLAWGDMDTVDEIKTRIGDEILSRLAALFACVETPAAVATVLSRVDDMDHLIIQDAIAEFPNFRLAMMLAQLDIVALPNLACLDSTTLSLRYPLAWSGYISIPRGSTIHIHLPTFMYRDEFLVPDPNDIFDGLPKWNVSPIMSNKGGQSQWGLHLLDRTMLREFIKNPVMKAASTPRPNEPPDEVSVWAGLRQRLRRYFPIVTQ